MFSLLPSALSAKSTENISTLLLLLKKQTGALELSMHYACESSASSLFSVTCSTTMIASLIELKTCFVSISLNTSLYSDRNFLSSRFWRMKKNTNIAMHQTSSYDSVSLVTSLFRLSWWYNTEPKTAAKYMTKYKITNPSDGAARVVNKNAL